MKWIGWLILAAVVLTVACQREEAEAPASTAPPAAEPQWTVKGTIVSTDAEANWVQIDHQNIPGLMAAMTMTFPVSDASLLEGIEEGDVVEFTLVQKAEGLVVTELRKVDPAVLEQGQEGRTYNGRGLIKVVNRPLATVILENEEIPGQMPAGELVLQVSPPSLLEGIEDGTRVEFTLTDTASGLVITDLKKLEE